MDFCNIHITDSTKEKLFQLEPETQVLIPLNAECFVRSNENLDLLKIVNRYRTTIDGQIPLWLIRLKKPNYHIEKLSGSNLVFEYCNWAASNNYRIFFLGGRESSNLKALQVIKKSNPNIVVEGYSPPYEPYPFTELNDYEILKRINNFRPHIILIGFGFGKQERWVDQHIEILSNYDVKWVICCGGSFEFISGEIKRAPKVVQQIGLEGVWRLLMEPKLFRLKRLLLSLKILKYI